MEDDKVEPNADTPPPGSSESFNDFKDRILSTMGGYVAANEGHNTVFVTHSKAIGVVDGAEYAGWPEDGNIHMPTFEKAKEKAPGGHQEIEIPQHAIISPLPKSKQEDELPSIFSPEFWYSEERANKVAAQAMEFRDKFNQDPIGWLSEKLKGGDFSKQNPTDVMPLIGSKIGNRSKMPPREVLVDMLNRNLRPKEMADELGVDRNAVYRYLDRYDLAKAGAKGPKPTEVDWDLYDRLKAKGVEERDIAAAFGVQQRTLFDARKRRAIPQEQPSLVEEPKEDWTSKILDARIKGAISKDSSALAQNRLATELKISPEELQQRINSIREAEPEKYGIPETMSRDPIASNFLQQSSGGNWNPYKGAAATKKSFAIKRQKLGEGKIDASSEDIKNVLTLKQQLILKRWNEGASAEDIQKELADGSSRNAVMGHVHRIRKRIDNIRRDK